MASTILMCSCSYWDSQHFDDRLVLKQGSHTISDFLMLTAIEIPSDERGRVKDLGSVHVSKLGSGSRQPRGRLLPDQCGPFGRV